MNIKHRLQAWAVLLGRYRAVFAYWWSRRREISQPNLRAYEAEFLPSALAVQHKPVSPAGRWVARLLVLLLVSFLLWATLGHVDITVDARGKIIPDGQTKAITAAQVAPVRAILVSEGQEVRAGQALIELDARPLEAEREKDVVDWQAANLQVARSRALLEGLRRDRRPSMPPLPGAESYLWSAAAAQLLAQWDDFTAKRARLDADIARFLQALPLATRIAEDYSTLAITQDVPATDALAKEQTVVELRGELLDARAQRTALIADARKGAEYDVAQAIKAAADARADGARMQAQIDQATLRSPVSGTVQQLAVHTVGAAVPAAQPLLAVVPANRAVELEAMLADKDVGFVRVGQEAEVKIDAFDYTKYGTIPARVSFVSRDSVEDKHGGLQYAVRLVLLRRDLDVDGVRRELTPGMSGTAEIRTGRRRVIQFFLSPVIRRGTGSLHER